MRFGSILQLLEDLIFELLSWILFIPKTFILSVQPGKVQTYVAAEWERDADEKYEEYVSPVLFYIGMIMLGVLETAASRGRNPVDYLGQLFQLTDLVLVQVLFGVFLWPLLTAIVLQLAQRLWKGLDFDRNSFRRLFDMQCLYWGFFVAVGPLLGIIGRLAPEQIFGLLEWFGIGVEVVVVSYLGFLISKTVEAELELRWPYALAISIAVVVAVRFTVVLLIGNAYEPLFDLIDR